MLALLVWHIIKCSFWELNFRQNWINPVMVPLLILCEDIFAEEERQIVSTVARKADSVKQDKVKVQALDIFAFKVKPDLRVE